MRQMLPDSPHHLFGGIIWRNDLNHKIGDTVEYAPGLIDAGGRFSADERDIRPSDCIFSNAEFLFRDRLSQWMLGKKEIERGLDFPANPIVLIRRSRHFDQLPLIQLVASRFVFGKLRKLLDGQQRLGAHVIDNSIVSHLPRCPKLW